MAEAPSASTPTPAAKAPEQVCQKCRNAYPLEAFQHRVAGQESVCRRCLVAMGYQV